MKYLLFLLPFFIWGTSTEKCGNSELTVQKNSYEVNRTTVNTIFVNSDVPVICESLLLNMTEVNYLSFSNVHIKEVEVGAFRLLIHLKSLILSKNEIKKIIPGVFENSTITDLDLSENQISAIKKHTFLNMFNLEDLNLGKNQISELQEDWFAACPKLNKIRLYFNRIKEISSTTFNNLNPELGISLLLGANNITIINENALDKLHHILELTLHANQIEEFPSDFLQNLKRAELMDFGSNKLKCVPAELLAKSAMTFLTNNPLTDTCVVVLKSVIRKQHLNVYSEKLISTE